MPPLNTIIAYGLILSSVPIFQVKKKIKPETESNHNMYITKVVKINSLSIWQFLWVHLAQLNLLLVVICYFRHVHYLPSCPCTSGRLVRFAILFDF